MNAAALLLDKHGYEATTVRTIAAAVGIKAGSLYHHFPSKDRLVCDVMNEGVRVTQTYVERALEALPEGAGARARVRAAAEAHLRAFLEHSAYTSAAVKIFPRLPPALREANRQPRRDYEALWQTLIEDVVVEGGTLGGARPEMAKFFILGAMNWAAEWYRPGRLGIDEIADDMTRLLVGPEGRTA